MTSAPLPATSAPTGNLAGLVERVTFHNEENGFCVLRMRAHGQRDLVTVVGHAAMIAASESVQAAGTWINDRTHGLYDRVEKLRSDVSDAVSDARGEKPTLKKSVPNMRRAPYIRAEKLSFRVAPKIFQHNRP